MCGFRFQAISAQVWIFRDLTVDRPLGGAVGSPGAETPPNERGDKAASIPTFSAPVVTTQSGPNGMARRRRTNYSKPTFRKFCAKNVFFALFSSKNREAAPEAKGPPEGGWTENPQKNPHGFPATLADAAHAGLAVEGCGPAAGRGGPDLFGTQFWVGFRVLGAQFGHKLEHFFATSWTHFSAQVGHILLPRGHSPRNVFSNQNHNLASFLINFLASFLCTSWAVFGPLSGRFLTQNLAYFCLTTGTLLGVNLRGSDGWKRDRAR